MRRDVLERLMSHVKIDDAMTYNGTPCWLWTALRDRSGYGKIKVDGEHRGSHRISYALIVGHIPEGLTIDHLCRVRHCVNPAHLEAVTCKENVLRGDTIAAKNKAKTHCDSGHAFDIENTYNRKEGGRECRECRRIKFERRRIRDRIRKQSTQQKEFAL